MSLLIIIYDLKNAKSERYKRIDDAITGNFETWYRILNTTWAIKTDKDRVEVRDYLKDYIELGDKLIVFQSNTIAWVGTFPSDESEWLRNSFK